MLDLNGKIVCITGASSGIGRACAEVFAKTGARLILIARRNERLQDLVQYLKTEVYPICLDIQDSVAVKSAMEALPAAWKSIDVLINNAGLAKGRDPMVQGAVADWDSMIDTNIKGLLYTTQAVLVSMLTRQSGHIINIGSIAGREVYAGGLVYCATKHAVRGLTAALKLEVHGTPIRVTEIAPGMVETEFSIVRARGDIDAADKLYADMMPLKAEDIADTVFFAATRPLHVNISEILVLPTDQSAISVVHRHAPAESL